ncbi:MAG: hypothetical protein H0T53_12905 [Herpetosiphonaceae bacterium]|nr:hypothetical protein [Herpetosiphonaceae bacterium]
MLRRILVLLLLATLAHPATTAAQAIQWNEQQTTYIAVLYPAGSEAEAKRYIGFADQIYTEISTALGYKPAPPLTLRIYPTMEIYRQVNPMAQSLEGIVAHAHTGRREISIAVPQTVGQTDEEIRNNVRHEITHVVAAELSDNQLSIMWQEGIAQYVEQPAPQLEIKVDLLRQAVDSNSLLSWSRLDAPGVMYSNPRLGYPQSWSMVSFLIQRAGMAQFVTFMQAMRSAGGYRSALQQVYGSSADTLEAEWRAQLAAWIDGGWRVQPSAAFDLGSIQAALDAGRYSDAETGAAQALAGGDDPALQTLLDLARLGVAADRAAAAARAALLQGDYPAATGEIERARPLYAQLNRSDVTPLLDEYAGRASDGTRAERLLAAARADIGSLRLSAARRNIEQAALIFAQLGDQQGRARAEELLASLNNRLRIAGVGLLILVVLGLAWNIDRRRSARARTLPFG